MDPEGSGSGGSPWAHMEGKAPPQASEAGEDGGGILEQDLPGGWRGEAGRRLAWRGGAAGHLEDEGEGGDGG